MAIVSYYEKIRGNDPLTFLSKFICPYLVGDEWWFIRRCFLLQCVTHSRPDMRIRLHMLLNGTPGTGKTEFLNWVRQNCNGVFVNAELTSKVGLVGDARGEDITPGLLARSDGEIFCCDELDKMGNDDQSGLLQAMEEGEYTITKGSEHQRFRSEIRCVGACNNLNKVIMPLQDRFDFIFNVFPATRQQRAENSSNIIETFIKKPGQNYWKIVEGYLEWIKETEVNWNLNQLDSIKKLIKAYILQTQTNIDMVSYRNLELSIMRIAYAMARLEKKDATLNHIKESIKLKDAILKAIVGLRK